MADIGTPGSSQPILIIEDSDDDFDATKRALNKGGNIKNPIHRCGDGQDGLDYLLQQGRYSTPGAAPRPGIILLDLNMPGMDGRQFLAEVKHADTLKRIPILVMTTSNNQEDIDYCYEVGANTYIQKPFDWAGSARPSSASGSTGWKSSCCRNKGNVAYSGLSTAASRTSARCRRGWIRNC